VEYRVVNQEGARKIGLKNMNHN